MIVGLFKALQVIIALSLLILIHESGHFLFARIFGIRVEKFYLFFDIGGKALCRFRIGETEFGIGVLPFGGYCKIAGMIDESMDLEQMKREPQPWEFRTHPAWQRLMVMAGGVLFNFIFAILAYGAILGIWGDGYVPNESSRIYAGELAQDMGFRTGDRILSLDDYVPEDFGMLQADIARRSVRKAVVERGEDTVSIYIDQNYIGNLLNTPGVFALALPFEIDSVIGPNAALAKGDRVLSIGGEKVDYLQEATPILMAHKGSSVDVTLKRDGDEMTLPVQVDSAGHIGVVVKMPEIRYQHYNALTCIPAGWKKTWSTVGGYLRDLRMVATPSTGAYKSVGSFIAIGQIFPSVWDWFQFMNIIALLSIMLAIMNLIPIPGLDGGHIVLTLFEMATGRKPSERFLVVTQAIGMFLLLALLMLAFGNDITRLIR
ncbi:MAG: RIP metalloprotease RseP [Bacteroidales bacterium]|nr:RIP metalloprotease RseP [Bacteroidales bacterium]